MQIHNLSWLADINKPIFTKKTDYQAVLKNTSGLPFITPPLHPELIEMLDKIGAEGRVEAGEKFPMALDSEDSFVLIKNGIAAREIQLLNSSLINLVLPSRSLCGDLNLFTNRGIKEQHFSITPCQYVLVSKKLLLSLLFKNPEILNAALSDIEQISLSHQLSLLIAGSLAVEERILRLGLKLFRRSRRRLAQDAFHRPKKICQERCKSFTVIAGRNPNQVEKKRIDKNRRTPSVYRLGVNQILRIRPFLKKLTNTKTSHGQTKARTDVFFIIRKADNFVKKSGL